MEVMNEQSALDNINQMFPTVASLSGVEPFMQKVNSEIRRVDAEILTAICQQRNSGRKAREGLAAATKSVQELMYKTREIKTKAEKSETMVQELCRDIKKLDFAKKNITATITALHRLTMLVSGVDQLQVMASKRQYKAAAAQLEAVNQLCCHFEAYSDIPKITELKEKFKSIKKILKAYVFSDFSSIGSGKETEDGDLLQQLSEACLVVDALEPSVREELVNNICNIELTKYQHIFEGAEYAKLDQTERRYAWIKRRVRANEDVWRIFPPSWHFASFSCIQFCKLTRMQLVDILDNLKEKPDVLTLLAALKKTLEFEEELTEKFGSEEEGSDELSEHGAGFNFHGIISSCFEPYLIYYVEQEEKTLMDHVEKLVQEETWDIEEGSQMYILSSSMQMFIKFRSSLKKCIGFTKFQTLFNLFQVFQRTLKTYATKLYSKLPKGRSGIKTSDKDEKMICYIANTAEYCGKTAGELAENVSKIIDPQFSDKVDMSEVQDEFSAVITKALLTLVHGMETKFDAQMAAMTRLPWSTLEIVGDQSRYVNGINSIFTRSIPVLGSLLSSTYFQFFLDKLASSLAHRFYLNIFKCKQISETGAQQMLLDTQAVKAILLDIPSLAKQNSATSSYSKFIIREMSKAEAFLKVILSPVDSVADTYCALMPEGTPKEFERILELKGLRRTDQQTTISDDFSNSAPPVLMSNASDANMGVWDDVFVRAAALGRGAYTGGFKKFLAMTEAAAKDRKDFRKIFTR